MHCCAKHVYNNNDRILIQISELQTGKKYINVNGFICLNCCIIIKEHM